MIDKVNSDSLYLLQGMEYNDVLLNFAKLIKQFSEIENEQVDALYKSTRKITYKPNDYFSTPKNQSPSIAFITKGLFAEPQGYI